MHPILFSWQFITLTSYGVLVALGFLVGIFLTLFLSQREKMDPSKILDLAVIVMLAAILGARLFYVIEFWPDFLTRPWEVFMVWQGGLVFYGGLMVALIATMVFLLLNRLPFWRVLDLATLGTVLGMSIGRLGCFMNGCCYGKTTEGPWAVTFPNLIGPRHPTQLYESFDLLLIFLLLLYLYARKNLSPGLIFAWGLMLYTLHRFLVEFLRENPHYVFNLSEAQIISVVLLLVGIWILVRRRKV